MSLARPLTTVRLHSFPVTGPPVSFASILALQERLVQHKLAHPKADDHLISVQHSPVITLGRRSHADPPSSTAIPIIKVQCRVHCHPPPSHVLQAPRGGQATYHGPGQVVLYPVLDLRRHRQSLEWYVERLAQVMALALRRAFSIDSHYDKCPTRVGLWLSPTVKIGFIGIRAQRWIVSHGLAVNVTRQAAEGFRTIVPCGLDRETSISCCEDHCQLPPDAMPRAETALIDAFAHVFNCNLQPTNTAQTE